jgi:hypothetical protein
MFAAEGFAGISRMRADPFPIGIATGWRAR